MPSQLKNLDFKEEKERYDIHSEKKDVSFKKCSHKDVEYKDGMLRCPCGASWSGPRLQELFDNLKKRNKI